MTYKIYIIEMTKTNAVNITNVSNIMSGSNNRWVRTMVFNDTFNNISAKSWWSVLLVEETRVTRENH